MTTINACGNGLFGSSGSGSYVGSVGATLTNANLITVILGTPQSGILTNCTGLPIAGLTGLGTGVATALAANVSGSGGIVLVTSATLITPHLGTPASGTLTNCTGLPVSTGINGLGTGVATALAAGVSGSGNIALVTNPTFVTPTLGAASATSVSFSSTSGIIGTTTNNNAASGSVGEFVSSVIPSGSATSISTGAATNLTSISLTAGDWDVYGNIYFTGSLSAAAVWISLISASLPDPSLFNEQSGTISSCGLNAPFVRLSLSSTTTVYITGYVNISAGSSTQCGGIYARRAR